MYLHNLWHDVGHSFLLVWVWVSASQRIPLSALARNPHKGLARKISNETGRRQEKVRSQGSQEELAAVRERRRSEKGSRQRGAGTCGLRSQGNQRERMSQCSWWLCGNSARIHARDSHRCTENHRKAPKLFSSCAWK